MRSPKHQRSYHSFDRDISHLEKSRSENDYHSEYNWSDSMKFTENNPKSSNTYFKHSWNVGEEELDAYIYDTQLQTILDNYIPGIKKVIKLLL